MPGINQLPCKPNEDAGPARVLPRSPGAAEGREPVASLLNVPEIVPERSSMPNVPEDVLYNGAQVAA